MTIRNLLLTACSVALLAGCDSDSTGPTAQVEGTYTLTTVGGQSLPFTIQEVDADNRIDVLAGVIVLDDDGTFTDETDLNVVVDGVASTEPVDAAGTYVVSGTTITFTPTAGSAYSAVIDASAGTITQNVEGTAFVYTR